MQVTKKDECLHAPQAIFKNPEPMNRINQYLNLLTGMIMLAFIVGCVFPFTTASYKWDIKYDKAGVAFKKNFLQQSLPPLTGEQPPNILLIVVDDLGKSEVSCYGSTSVRTPHMDQLASEGILFTDCYVTAPVCAPSRAALLTGRYNERYGFETQPMEMYPNNLPAYWLGKYMINTGEFVLDEKPRFPPEWQIQKQGLLPTEINLAELLKMRGYSTACIGKWHLGFSKDHIPNNRGFDYQYGFYGAFSLYSEKRKDPGMVNYIQDSFSAKHQWRMGRKETSAIRRNDRIIREKRYLTDAIKEEAIAYMAQHRKDPFFLYVAFNAVHVPFQAPRYYYELYDGVADENKRVYYAMVSALDDAIGEMMEKMKLLGLENNTIIYLVSDNGGAVYTKATDNKPYKGGKLTMFEGGVNVPFMMKWKGMLPAGMTYEHPVSSMDIFMTSVKGAGCVLPDDRTYDGTDLMPFLTREKEGNPHENFYWKADQVHAMRMGDWKYLESTRDGWIELYNLREDRYEHIDLHDIRPRELDSVKVMFGKWNKEMKPPLWPRLMDYKIMINGKIYLFPA
jgi:arylsulfatase A-like enzyme